MSIDQNYAFWVYFDTRRSVDSDCAHQLEMYKVTLTVDMMRAPTAKHYTRL